MSRPPVLVLPPLAPLKREAFARGLPLPAPQLWDDPLTREETPVLADLVASADNHVADWRAIFGEPDAVRLIARIEDRSRSLIAAWTRNLAWIVRHLVLFVALRRIAARPTPPAAVLTPAPAVAPAGAAAQPLPASGARAPARTLVIATRVRPRDPDIHASDLDASPTGAPHTDDPDTDAPEALASAPGRSPRCEGARWADLFLRTARTLETLEACAARLVRRIDRLGIAADAGAIRPADPPPWIRPGCPDRSYNPLVRLAQLVWRGLAAELAPRSLPPAPDDS